jgi:hypothetical protein
VDRDGNIHIKNLQFPATKGLGSCWRVRGWIKNRLPAPI